MKSKNKQTTTTKTHKETIKDQRRLRRQDNLRNWVSSIGSRNKTGPQWKKLEIFKYNSILPMLILSFENCTMIILGLTSEGNK